VTVPLVDPIGARSSKAEALVALARAAVAGTFRRPPAKVLGAPPSLAAWLAHE